MLLVPAFMRVLGRANWWAPKRLARLHERFGLSETAERRAHLQQTVGEPAAQRTDTAR
jgi:putative drug exporter of the RND superfamily